MSQVASPVARYRVAARRSAALAGALALLALGAPLLFGLHYVGVDLTQINMGNHCAVRRLLEEGTSLWLSPHMGNGTPLLVRPSAQLFYPLRWLMLTLPLELATSLEQILHLAAGAAAATWLGFTFRLRPLGAVCAGLSFAFCGTAVDLINHTSYFTLGAAYLPLVWAAARRACHPRARCAHRLVVGAALSLLLLGGAPQSFGIGAALVLFEVVRAARGWPRARRRSLALLAMVPAALLVGGVLWVGYWLEGTLSPRSAALSAADVLGWSFDASLWPAALWPGALFSEPLPYASLWQKALAGELASSAWNPSPYVGILFVTALLCGLGRRRARPAVLVCAIGLLFALGDSTPVMPLLLKLIPVLGLFRYPEKYLLVTTLAGVVVVAVVLEDARRDRALRRRLVTAAAAMLVGQLVLLAVLWGARAPLDALVVEEMQRPFLRGRSAFSSQLMGALLQSSAPLVAALLLWILAPGRRALAAVLVVVDLFVAALGAAHLGPALSDLPSPLPALVEPVGAARARLCSTYSVKMMSIAAEGEDPVWNTMALFWLYGEPELQACHGLAAVIPYGPLCARTSLTLYHLTSGRNAAAARALGCTHLITDSPFLDEALAPVSFDAYPPQVRRFLASGPRIYRVRESVPDAFVVRAPRMVASEEEALGRALSAAELEVMLGVLDDPLSRLSAGVALPDGAGAQGVSVRWTDPARAWLEVDGGGAAVVGVGRPFLVGWRAAQGGRPLPVLRVAATHLGVLVEDVGAGPIELRYQSPGFWPSLLGAALGLLTIVVAALLGRPVSRRRRARGARA